MASTCTRTESVTMATTCEGHAIGSLTSSMDSGKSSSVGVVGVVEEVGLGSMKL